MPEAAVGTLLVVDEVHHGPSPEPRADFVVRVHRDPVAVRVSYPDPCPVVLGPRSLQRRHGRREDRPDRCLHAVFGEGVHASVVEDFPNERFTSRVTTAGRLVCLLETGLTPPGDCPGP